MGPRCPLPGWVARPTEGQMVFVVGREAWVIQNRMSTPPNNRPATHLRPRAGKTQLALDFIKQVYSHFRKTNSRTGNGFPISWV